MSAIGASKLALFIIAAALTWSLWPELSNGDVANDILKVLVPALVVVFGWILTFLLQEHRLERARKKQEIDLQLALRAEIWDYQNSFIPENVNKSRERVIAKIRESGAEEAFYPSIPQEKAMMIFGALIQHIDRLPPATVDLVVQFYSQLNDVELFFEDLRRDSFIQMSPDRRAQAYSDYIDMKLEAHNRAIKAVEKLNKSLGVVERKPTKAELLELKQDVQSWLNSSAQGRSDH